MVNRIFTLLFSVSALVGATVFQNPHDLRYGSLLRTQASVTGPAFWGTWLPGAHLQAGGSWIEPMDTSRLGDLVPCEATYLRFGADILASPWFAMVQAQLGVRLLPRLELGAIYQALAYHKTNVEQGMKTAPEKDPITETWRADYYWDHLYKGDRNDYYQAFGLMWTLDLSYRKMMAGIEYHLFLIDVSTYNTLKSLDPFRNLPVHKRDFFMEYELWTRVALWRNWNFAGDMTLQQTGVRTWFFGNYDKEPLMQAQVYAGMQYSLDKAQQQIVFQPGFLWRSKLKEHTNLQERILLRLFWELKWTTLRGSP